MARGFTAHADSNEGFIAQLEGRKRWRVLRGPPPFSRPLRDQAVGKPWATSAAVARVNASALAARAAARGELALDVTLGPGDVLCVASLAAAAAAARPSDSEGI